MFEPDNLRKGAKVLKTSILLVLLVVSLGPSWAGAEFNLYLPGFMLDRIVTGGIYNGCLDGSDKTDLEITNRFFPEIAFNKTYGVDEWDSADTLLQRDNRNPNTSYPKIWRAKIWGEDLETFYLEVYASWYTSDPTLRISGEVFFGDQSIDLSFNTLPISLPQSKEYDVIVEISQIPEPPTIIILGLGCLTAFRLILRRSA